MYIMETSRVVVHQPVESACIVFNMDKFTLKNMVCITSVRALFFIFVWGGVIKAHKIGTKNSRKGSSVTTDY